MTHTSTEQPEALMRLADRYAEACFDQGLNQRTTDDKPETEREKLENAIRHQHARIAELEAQLSAIGAGGVEPLRKPASVAAHDALPEPAFYGRLEKHYFFLPKVEECKISDDGAIGFYTEQQVRALLAATQPAEQGLEMANCKGDKWLTVVYRDIQPGDEARAIVEHPKVSALSWSHALHDRDAALAAKAKQGERP